MITFFLGAGFSSLGRVPLASQLFDRRPEVDSITRQSLVDRVLGKWQEWLATERGTPEEYLAALKGNGFYDWRDAQWYISLVIAIQMGNLRRIGRKLSLTGHNLNRTSGVDTHEELWTKVFSHTCDVAIVTTNYDILAERGLRHETRPRAHRPGFNYGDGPQNLAGKGYPSYAHLRPVCCTGKVPIFKLHGSISWSLQNGALTYYYDCRPAIRGDAAIIPPVTGKRPTKELETVWSGARQVLEMSSDWIVIGYSLPEYDEAVAALLLASSSHGPKIHVCDPNISVANRYAKLLPCCSVSSLGGLPAAIDSVARVAALSVKTSGPVR